MNPDTLIPLVEAADALDRNSRLLRMFELEPLIAAEPDSPEKHRALARCHSRRPIARCAARPPSLPAARQRFRLPCRRAR